MSHKYQVCKRCVMDTSAEEIHFDENGVCHFCRDFLDRSGNILFKKPAERSAELERFVAKVKADGQGKPYDCIVGVSGGVDSSWALLQAVRLGLRPLAVHMDNGWNSELAQNNIANLVRSLGVNLYTHVIDWEEYRKLMQAFFDSDVIDVELLYDNAMLAVNYQQANKFGVKYILAGTNQATEGMRMPKAWNWFKYDKKNIANISRQFKGPTLSTFPTIGTIQYISYEFIKKIKWVSFLDNFDFNKDEVLRNLSTEFAYKPYPYKHYESVFTRFYQGYILPKKFGVDKRRLHLSTLIVSGQMNRSEALAKLDQIPYPSMQDLENDRLYFLKKMRWTEKDLTDYLSRPRHEHDQYGSEKKMWDFLSGVYKNYLMRG